MKCPKSHENQERVMQISCDSVTECKSSLVSLDVYSFKMANCKQIYPHQIIRPLGKTKLDHNKHLEYVISDLVSNQCRIAAYLADNLKRANARECLNHASLFPCEYCFARGVRITPETVNKDKKNNDIKLALINDKIESLPKNSSELKVLKEIQKELQAVIKKSANKKSHIVWPYSTMKAEPRTNQEMLNIVERIENGENLTSEEKKGVIRRSPLLKIPGFNFVRDAPVDYMHGVCIGVVKRLVELTFQVGESRTRKTKRKLSSPAQFNKLMRDTKMTREFSRRARDICFSVMKATEFRNLCLFFFPHVLACLEPSDKERKLWLFLAYMIRACIVPEKEFKNVNLEDIDFCCDKYYALYESLFGPTNCTYNSHVVLAHLIEMRYHGPLTLTSTFEFESFYGEMRNAFVPGTQSPIKQIFQKTLLKRALSNHSCKKGIYFSPNNTPLECNNLIYTFVDLQYHIYKIISQEENQFQCHEFNVTSAKFKDFPKRLVWSKVGVFQDISLDETSTKRISKSQIRGKVLKVSEFLITCPNSILREK